MLVRAKKTGIYRQGNDIIVLTAGKIVDLADPFNPNRGDSDLFEQVGESPNEDKEISGNVSVDSRVQIVMEKRATYADGKNVVKLEAGKKYMVPAAVAEELRKKGKI